MHIRLMKLLHKQVFIKVQFPSISRIIVYINFRGRNIVLIIYLISIRRYPRVLSFNVPILILKLRMNIQQFFCYNLLIQLSLIRCINISVL